MTEIKCIGAQSITNKIGEKLELSNVLNVIKNDTKLAGAIGSLRAGEEAIKLQLPWFTLGTFDGDRRNIDSFVETEALLFDLDHLDEKVEPKRTLLMKDEHVLAVFTSPRGRGLKFIVKLENKIVDLASYEKAYAKVGAYYNKKLQWEYDKACKDPSRACFLSSDTNTYINSGVVGFKLEQDSKNIKPKSIVCVSKSGKYEPQSLKEIMGLCQSGENEGKVQCLCPICGDNPTRGNPGVHNAFIFLKNNTLHLWCSSENRMYTLDKKLNTNLLNEHVLLGKNVHKIIKKPGTVEIGRPLRDSTFFSAMDANDKGEQCEAWNKLESSRLICGNYSIETLSSGEYETDRYEEIRDETGSISIFKCYNPPVATDKEDNSLINGYLNDLFGSHTTFIKKWLAMYCYTNFIKMPTILFTGPRGSGKTTFLDLVSAIFPGQTAEDAHLDDGFSDHFTKKFLPLDEGMLVHDKKAYTLLKRLSGNKTFRVNPKGLPAYTVPNNLHTIVATNDSFALFTKKDELPTDENNNQFFVFKFHPRKFSIDNSLETRLIATLGHYVRTELKSVFEGLRASIPTYRYGIAVPITNEQVKMFASCETSTEIAVEAFIGKYGHQSVIFSSDIADFVEQYGRTYGVKITQLTRALKEGYMESVGRSHRSNKNGKKCEWGFKVNVEDVED